MLNSGTVLQNRYQIIRQLGAGGMGAVYLAYDQRLGNRQVVIKQNLGGDPQLFRTEATILATLRHPNLPRVTDHFIEASATTARISTVAQTSAIAQPGAQYLVMDYIEGQTLEQVVRARGMLPEPDALACLNQVFDAVRYLHANRIIHRDIKPQNIIITPDSRAMLVDFGIAKVMQVGSTTHPGARGMVSPGYAPLEQYSGGTDERSDVYALGAVLFFALTGLEPPTAPDRANGAPLPPPRASNPSVSRATERAISQAMALVSNQRFQNIAAMEQALQAKTVDRGLAIPWLAGGVGIGVGALLIVCIVAIVVLINIYQPTLPQTGAAIATASPTAVLLGGGPTIRPADTLVPPPTSAPTITPIIPAAATATPRPTPTATLPPTPAPPLGAERVIGGAPMMFVPAGEFTMGSDGGAASEQPAHKVFLDGFWIDKYEVSNQLYMACAPGSRCRAAPPAPNWKGDYFTDSQYATSPLINVTWAEASAYCADVGKRLPTEAEWEKAARGTDARTYPWGNDWNPNCAQYGWSPSKGHYQVYARVDGYANCPSPAGALNMAGNVWEWVADWYDAAYYKNLLTNNPKGPASGQLRILRGGSVLDQPSGLRTTNRFPSAADFRADNVGFRCAQ